MKRNSGTITVVHRVPRKTYFSSNVFILACKFSFHYFNEYSQAVICSSSLTHPSKGAVVSHNQKQKWTIACWHRATHSHFEYRVDILWVAHPMHDLLIEFSTWAACVYVVLRVFVWYFRHFFSSGKCWPIYLISSLFLSQQADPLMWLDGMGRPIDVISGCVPVLSESKEGDVLVFVLFHVSVETCVASCLILQGMISVEQNEGAIHKIGHRRTCCWRVLLYLNLDNWRLKDQHLGVLPVEIIQT